MSDDDLDRRLARRFGDLRAADDLRTPSFRGVLGRAPRPGTRIRGRRLPLFLGAAAAAAVVALGVVLLRPAGEPSGAAASATAIAEWRSPTDSLLATPGNELYGEPPPAAEPIPGWIRDFQRVPPGAPSPAPSIPARKGVAS